MHSQYGLGASQYLPREVYLIHREQNFVIGLSSLYIHGSKPGTMFFISSPFVFCVVVLLEMCSRTVNVLAKCILVLLSTFMASSGIAQTGCDMPLELPIEQIGVACGLAYSYSPLVPEHVPIKTLKVAYHLFQNDDGSGNFSLNNPDHVAYLNNVEMVVNLRLANLGPLNIGNSPYIIDTRVRIDVVAMYEHRNTSVINVPDAATQYQDYVIDDASGYGLSSEDITGVEHILLAGQYGDLGCCGGRASWFGEQGWIVLDSWYEHFMAAGPTSFSWTIPGHFIHEMGHAMNLDHNYLSGGCDVCSDNDAVPGGPCPSIGMSNNYMDARADLTPGAENGYNASNPDPGLSACQLGIVHHALEGNIANRTIWRVVREDHCVRDPDAAIAVSGTYIWNDSKKLQGDLIITSGSTLTVKCRIHMPAGAKVIVQQGARLIIDEGQFTNLCGEFWHGIEVWGTSGEHQFPADNPTYQGLLVLKNGAIIEHAREGFTNWKPGDWNSIGGVIQVQGTPNELGATLLNNRRSAGFMAYQNFHPGYPNILRPNTSYFKYAHFKVDDDYRGGNDFHDHVSMWKVDGIHFRACTFENAQTNVPGSTELGRGIFSIDANYTVGGNCTVTFPNCCPPCPPESLHKGAFIGLGHGIDARDGGSGRGFTVQDCRFENNVVGVYTEGLHTFTVAKNEFILGDRNVALDGVVDDNFQEDHHRGVSTQLSFGFRIEENAFHRAANTTALGVDAIVIENSLSNNTQVYKNDAFDMDRGYIGEGNCIDGFQASSIGHQFLCNTNDGNEQNFWVRKDDDGTATWNHSIRTQQGSDPSPAGNLFDQETGVVDESDYKNETAWVINYWHAAGQSEPMDFTPGWFGKTLATGTNGCPSKLSGKEVKITPGLQEQVAGELQAAKAAYISTAYVFNSLLDGGNTDAVIEEVQQSWPSEAWELRQYLLSRSPYLSTEVLKEMMQRNTLPLPMVLEICLANPEATKKDGFTRWAEHEAPNPLPSYMIDLIAGSWAPKTFRMQLEAQMGQHHADMSAAADMLQDALRSDEEEVHPSEALAVWQQLPNYGARYGEIAARLRMNDFDGARSVLNNLASTYPMKAEREAERDRTLWYVDQLEALHGSGREFPQLTEAEVTQWQAFALAAGDIPGTWAGNVLCFFHEVCFGRGGGPTIGNKSLRPTVQHVAGIEQAPSLALLPNPASTWVTLAHKLTEPVENAYALVLDARGRQVASLTIAAARGQQVWDTRQVPAGVYTVELFNNGQRVETKRLVVQPQN